MPKPLLLAAAVAAALHPLRASLAAEALDEVVVTPNRTGETAGEALASVSVITRADIERAQTEDVVALLRREAGIDFGRTGGRGQQTSMFLRGTDSDHVLVMIDGVRVNPGTTGAYPWEQLPLSQVERIEIVRGPRAALYGSEAIGGVIQVFTRDNRGANARVHAGSFDTAGVTAGLGGGKTTRYSLQVSAEDSGGFSAKNANSDTAFATHDPDDDGFDNRSVHLGLVRALGAHVELGLDLLHGEMENDFDNGVSESRDSVIDARLGHQVSGNWHYDLALGITRNRLETDAAGAFARDTEIESERLSLEWINDWALASGALVTAGLAWREDRAENRDLGTGATQYDEAIDNSAAFARLDQPLGAWDVELAARVDDHSSAGTEATGQLSLGRRIGERLTGYASAGTAFKAPSLSELYDDSFDSNNPDLEAESSRNVELGLRYRPANGHHLELSVFDNRIEDKIAFVAGDAGYRLENIDEARIRGLETRYRGRAGGWHWRADLTLLDAEDADTDEDLLRRPERKLALGAGRDFTGGAFVDAELLAVSSHRDYIPAAGGTGDVDGYRLVSLSAGYPLGRHWELGARLENALDEDYELAAGYNAPERAAYLSLAYRGD